MESSDYLALVQRTRDWIAHQQLAPGARLPSERSLAALLQSDRWSVNRALLHLAGTGEIELIGRRRFVAAPPTLPPPLPSLTIPLLIAVPHPRLLSTLQRLGATPAPVPWPTGPACRKRLFDILESHPHGFLLWPPYFSPPIDDLLDACASAHIPFVVFESETFAGSSVVTDGFAAQSLALEHLRELGHEEVAYFTFPPDVSHATTVRDQAWKLACHAHGLVSSIPRYFTIDAVNQGQAVAHLVALRRDHPHVTALVCVGFTLGRIFLQAARTLGIRVPQDLSMVGLDGLVDSDPIAAGFTSVSPLPSELARLGAELLISQITEMNRSGRTPARERIRLVPRLAWRTSTGPAPGRPARTQKQKPAPNLPKRNTIDQDESDRRLHALQSWEPRYPLAIAHPQRLQPFELAPYCNRFMRRPRGWLGSEPLTRFPSGLKTIHGIPFHILQDGERGGAVALRSLKMQTSSSEPLPHRIEIALPQPAAALYFLHACGWVSAHRPFARYDIHLADGTLHSIPLIPYAAGPEDTDDPDAWNRTSNIQDWWPGVPQFSNADANHLIVLDPADPLEHERFLYTLQWINPNPSVPLDRLTLESNPDTTDSLILLALTLLSTEPSHASL